MGLPGSGKTYLAKRMQPILNAAWYNADIVREMANDWDFSPEGRIRQSLRMKNLADFEKKHGRNANVCVRRTVIIRFLSGPKLPTLTPLPPQPHCRLRRYSFSLPPRWPSCVGLSWLADCPTLCSPLHCSLLKRALYS